MSKSLIAFYSRGGENYFGGSIREVTEGNTKIASGILQELTGADLFQIEQATPYSSNYKECVAAAAADLKTNARPELVADQTIAGYDEIYLGFPNYCGTMPMAVWTWLENHDFTGKSIKPFCTNEGSGMGRSEADIKKICPSADVKSGLSIRGSEAAQAKDALKTWL